MRRASDDAELHARVQAILPACRAIVAALYALPAEREAAHEVRAAPVQPTPQPASISNDTDTPEF